jgi:hypothetical protein
MIKCGLGFALAALLLAVTTAESSAAMQKWDWPNGGTCMGGPKDGKFVRDLKFCNKPGRGQKFQKRHAR